jgi:hypothetical protein
MLQPPACQDALHVCIICSVCLRAQGVSKLLKLLLSRAQPKRVGVAPVTGAMLAGLAEAYVAAINDGAVPTIATAWQVCLCEQPGCLAPGWVEVATVQNYWCTPSPCWSSDSRAVERIYAVEKAAA